MNKSKNTLRFILAGSILAAVHAQAAVLFWDGAGANNNWSTLENWGTTGVDSLSDPAAIPTTGDEVVFYSTGGARLLTGSIDTAFDINSLTFGNGQTGAVTISAAAALTLNGTANYDPANYNSGASVNLGTVGLYVQNGSGAVTLGTSTQAVIIGAAQNWINNSSTTVGINSTITYSNLLTLNGGSFTLNTAGTGAGGATISGGSTVINSSTGAIFGTGTLELNSGTYQNSTVSTTRTLANAVSITGDFTFASGGGNNTFTGAVTTTGNRILTVNTSTTSFTTNTLTLGGNLTVGGTGAFISSGGINLNGADRTLTFNTGANAVTVSGAINDSVGGGTKLVLAGSGTNISVGTLSAGANNSPLIEVNGTGTFTFANGSTHPGGTTLVSGKIRAGGNTAFAAGPLVLSGGTLATSAAGGGGDRTFANATTINGTVALGDATFSGYAMTFTGTTTFDSNAVISNTNNNGLTFSTGSSVLTTGFTLNLGATPSAVTFSGGFTVPGAVASDNRTLTLNHGATAVTISGALVGSAASQTITLAGSGTNNTIGNITSGASAPNLIVNSTAGGIYTFTGTKTYSGSITLLGGTLTPNGNNNAANNPLGTGTLILTTGSFTGPNGGSGSDTTISNAINFNGSSQTLNFGTGSSNLTFQTGTVTVTNSPTLNLTATGATTRFNQTINLNGDLAFTGTHVGTYNFSGGFTTDSTTRNLTFGDSGPVSTLGVLSLGGDLNLTQNNTSNFALGTATTNSGGTKTLTLAGSKNITGTGIMSNGTGVLAVIVNSTTGGSFTFSGASTYSGGTTLTSGTIVIGADSTGGPPPTSGPFGTSTLALNGGILRAGNTRVVGNTVSVGGAVTIDASGNPTSHSVTLSGGVTLNASAGITYTSAVANSTHAITGLVTLNTSPTINLNSSAGTGTFVTWSGGLDLNNASRTLTVSGTATRALAISGTLKDTGGSGHNLTINGTNNVTASGLITTGTGNPGIIYSGTATFDAGTNASTWAGGFTLNSGTAKFDASSTVAALVLTNGPFGTGTLTLNGGWLNEGSTSQTIHNSLVLSGSVIIASTVNPGNSLTFNPTLVTSPSTNTITVSGATTIQTNHAGTNNLTLTGPITGASTPSLTIKGFNNGTGAALGTVTIINAGAASTFGALSIGESVASGSAGGRVQLNGTTTQMQNGLGSGAIAINYGGTLSYGNQAGDLNPTNAITVSNGGTFAFNTANSIAMTNSMVFNSGATLNSGNKTLTLSTATATLPTAGVLFVTGNQTTALTTAYPSFTGTMAFGGATTGGTTTFAAATTLSSVAASARTLAFNQTGGGNITFSSGLLLNANLTVAGSGNAGLNGAIPQGPAGSLGAVTESGSRSITVNMAPIGVVSVTRSATGWTGGTTVKGGVLSTDGGSALTQKMLGSAGVTLDGGFIRNSNNANNDTTWQDAIAVTANGGGIESFSTGNFQAVTFTGALTGSAPLTLRYGGNTGGGGSGSAILLAPAGASAYSGTITLATSTGSGRVQFNANSLNSIAASGISVGAGVAFGVDALATLTGNIAKFTTGTDSILVLDNMTGSNIDLSSGGINRDIRIGGTGYRNAITYTGTLTPFGTTYNMTPTDNVTVTFGTANQFTDAAGPITRNLDVRAGAVAPGSIGVATGILSITAAQNYTGTTTVAGTIRNALMGGGVQGTTLSLATAGELTATSAITVDNGSTFTLASGANTGASGASVTIKGGSTINVNSASPLRDDATLTLGGASGGGSYVSIATGTQTLGILTVAAGLNTINTNATGVLTLAGAGAGVYTRNAGGVVNFATLNTSFSNVPTGSSTSAGTVGAGGTQSILIGAFSGNANFVVANSGALAATTYDTQNVASSWGTVALHDGNINNSGAGFSGTTATGTVTINALRNVAAFASTITIGAAASDVLSINSGMVLQTTAFALNFNGPGSLATGGSEYIFNTQSVLAGITNVNAKLSSAVPLTMVGGAAFSILNLNNTANAITDVYLYGIGTLRVSGGAGSLGTGGTVYFNGGALSNNASGAAFSQNITVGAQGGALRNSTALNTTYQTGAITLNGNLTVGGGATSQTSGNITVNNNISGAGTMLLNGGDNGTSNKAIITLGGINSSWTGGIRLANDSQDATQLRLNSTTAAGTGPIVDAGRGALYFTTATASGTFSNDISNPAVIVNWATASPVTLSGKIFSTGAPIFQGYATGGAASELVLSGTVSFSGASGTSNGFRYNWSTTPTTNIQNFVNGQGGLTVGSTNYTGTTNITTTSTWQGAGNLFIDGPSGGLVSGALGFIRFSGASTFIPGAVGPGYLAALHQANDATNYGNGTVSGSTGGANGLFGFLLTGGSTYTLPEGKSFVIGSIGTSVAAGSGQVGGTLGSSGGGTATLLGGTKAAAGQLLAGFTGGDINIHANAASSNQSLNLSASGAGDTLVLGGASALVFTPTYGDSGNTSAITLLSKRTGTTTLNKIGAGTVDLASVAYTHTDGTSASADFAWNVTAGTLQAPNGASLANSLTLSNGSILKASGAITYSNAVTLGTGGGIVNTNGNSVTFDATSVVSGAALTKTGAGTLTLGGTNTYSGATAVSNGTLSFDNTAAGATAQALGTNIGASAITLGVAATSSGILSYTGATAALDKNIGVLGNGSDAIQNNGAGVLTLSGGISGSNATLTISGTGDTTITTTAVNLGAVSGALTKNGAGLLNINSGAQTYKTLTTTAGAGTTNVNVALTATGGTDVVANAKLRFGSVSQTLSSLTIGAGATVIFTSGTATGSLSGGSGGGKAPSLGGSAVVPEPGTLGLLLVGALGVLNRRRRQG